MKNVKIISGNFTEAGNYSAYDKQGTRFFVFQRVMENSGWKTNEDVTLPFFANVVSKPIGQLDANGDAVVDVNGTPVVTMREQVSCIFKTRQDVIDDAVEDISLEIDIQTAVQALATKSGLSQSRVNALLEQI